MKNKIKKYNQSYNRIIIINVLGVFSVLFFDLINFGYNTFRYLIGVPGIFNDFFTPLINAISKPVLSSEILKDSNFNSPFTPFNFFYFRVVGAFLFENPYIFAVTCMTLILLLVAWQFYRYTGQKNAVLMLLTSFPLLFAFFRGNVTIFLLALLIIALNQLQNGSAIRASIILGIMVGFQFPYAIFFLLIPIFSKQYLRYVFLASITAVSTYVVPYILVSGGISSSTKTFIELNKRWTVSYIDNNEGLLHGTSIYGAVKTLIFVVFNSQETSNGMLDVLNVWYVPSIVLSFIIIVYISTYKVWSIRLNNEEIQNYMSLSVAIMFVSFPQVSAFYKLIFLLPFAHNLTKNYMKNKYLINLILLLIFPKDFIHFGISEYLPGVTIASLVNPILLLVILVLTSLKTFNSYKIDRKPKHTN